MLYSAMEKEKQKNLRFSRISKKIKKPILLGVLIFVPFSSIVLIVYLGYKKYKKTIDKQG
jgi:hypothetical protein